MSLPFITYGVKNKISTPSHIYLGKSRKKNTNGFTDNFYSHHIDHEGCSEVFLFASIVGSKNIKLYPAGTGWMDRLNDNSSFARSGSGSFNPNNTLDPYIYIESRRYAFLDGDELFHNEGDGRGGSIIHSIEYRNKTQIVNFKGIRPGSNIQIFENNNNLRIKARNLLFIPNFTLSEFTEIDGVTVNKERIINTNIVSLIKTGTRGEAIKRSGTLIKSLSGVKCIKVGGGEGDEQDENGDEQDGEQEDLPNDDEIKEYLDGEDWAFDEFKEKLKEFKDSTGADSINIDDSGNLVINKGGQSFTPNTNNNQVDLFTDIMTTGEGEFETDLSGIRSELEEVEGNQEEPDADDEGGDEEAEEDNDNGNNTIVISFDDDACWCGKNGPENFDQDGGEGDQGEGDQGEGDPEQDLENLEDAGNKFINITENILRL